MANVSLCRRTRKASLILMLLLDRVMRNFTTPTLRVMRKFTILILLLSGGEIIIDAARLVVGAMLVMLTRLVIVIQIDGKLGRGRKLGRFIVAIRERFPRGDRLSEGALSS